MVQTHGIRLSHQMQMCWPSACSPWDWATPCSASQGIMFPRSPCLWHLCRFSQWEAPARDWRAGGGLGVMPGCFPSSPRLCGVPGRTKSPRWAWAPREGPGSVGSALTCWPAAVLASGSWTPSVIPLAQGGTNRLVCLTAHALGPQLFYCPRNGFTKFSASV